MSEMANKAEKGKRKRRAIESDQESEDLGQVPNPELYIAPTLEVYKNSNGRKEKDPEQEMTRTQQNIVIKEDVNSSIDPEESSAFTKEREDIIREKTKPKNSRYREL